MLVDCRRRHASSDLIGLGAARAPAEASRSRSCSNTVVARGHASPPIALSPSRAASPGSTSRIGAPDARGSRPTRRRHAARAPSRRASSRPSTPIEPDRGAPPRGGFRRRGDPTPPQPDPRPRPPAPSCARPPLRSPRTRSSASRLLDVKLAARADPRRRPHTATRLTLRRLLAPEIKGRIAERLVETFEDFIARAQGRDQPRSRSSTAGRLPAAPRPRRREAPRRTPSAAPPRKWTPDILLWRAYQVARPRQGPRREAHRRHDRPRRPRPLRPPPRGRSSSRTPTCVRERFAAWLLQQENRGTGFTDEQRAVARGDPRPRGRERRGRRRRFRLRAVLRDGRRGEGGEGVRWGWTGSTILEELNEALAA